MTTTDSRLSRLARALAVVVSRPPVAMASTPLKLRNPLNGGGLSTSRGARMASNARRQKERGVGRTLALRLGATQTGEEFACVVLTRISPKAFDSDNLEAAFKSVRDGIAEAWGIDDADPRVTWVTDWRKGPKDAVEAALWALPHASEPLVVEPTWRPMPHADSPVMASDVEVDPSDYERPRRVVVYGGLIQRREVRVTPNVIRARGGA